MRRVYVPAQSRSVSRFASRSRYPFHMWIADFVSLAMIVILFGIGYCLLSDMKNYEPVSKAKLCRLPGNAHLCHVQGRG